MTFLWSRRRPRGRWYAVYMMGNPWWREVNVFRTGYMGTEDSMTETRTTEQWAIVELMGHAQTAGMIRTSDLGGLLRLDVPMAEGFRTEYYGNAAIYAIRIVSEEIARAFAKPDREISAYDVPIVPRAEYEEALRKSRDHLRRLERENEALRHRLTAVVDLPALPEPAGDEDDDQDSDEDAHR